MREIKFRGKAFEPVGEKFEDKGWIYGFFVGNYNPSKEENEIEDFFIYEGLRNLSNLKPVDPKTVGEYTGQEDKNNKEIYEGDIIKYKDYGGREQEGSIVFVEYMWMAICQEDDEEGNHSIALEEGEEYEIIGNIFEDIK